MPLIPYPVVPVYPGVPSLPRLIGQAVPPAVSAGLGLAGALLGSMLQGQTSWGIFDSDGNPIWGQSGLSLASAVSGLLGMNPILSTNSVEYHKETRISEFPVEKGGFASYNKVELPGRPVVTYCLTGSEANRTSFLAAIDAACKSIDLYSVVTPEVTYIDHTIERYNYSRRQQHGATLLTVEIYLAEVRQIEAQYTQAGSQSQINQPQNSAASPTKDTGIVQSQAPQPSLLSQAWDKIKSWSGN
jgi:hypothetical protein